MREAVVLAGGLGTRLRSAVGGLPKSLAPVGGRPFLDWLLQALAREGFGHVVLSLGYRAEAITQHLHATGSVPGLDISHAVEQEPLGTGGAIRQSLAHVRGKQAFVLNGDTLVQADFAAMEAASEQHRARLVMALKAVDDVARYGAVRLSGDHIAAFVEKGGPGPGLINAGIYLARRDLFEGFSLPDRFSFEQDFVAPNLSELQPVACVTEGYFIDIGVPEDYVRAQTEIPALFALRPA
jgi:D-glycero-alpha-D-manno-heptose 1-phosphate guanylyltransferase